MAARTIVPAEELTLPHFYRSEGYNEVLKPLGFHHNAILRCVDAGETVAFYPLWSCADQRPLNQDDIKFLEACGPYIARGVKAARLLMDCAEQEQGSDFEPLSGWPTGIVLTDLSGHPIGMDNCARMLFRQLAAFDRAGDCNVPPEFVKDSLSHLAAAIADLLRCSSAGGLPPVVHIQSHTSGVTLKLRATITDRFDGADDVITVLVERGELPTTRHRRMMLRWGLSANELTILRCVSGRATLNEIATRIGVRKGTLKVYLRRLAEKLGAERAADLRTIERSAFSGQPASSVS